MSLPFLGSSLSSFLIPYEQRPQATLRLHLLLFWSLCHSRVHRIQATLSPLLLIGKLLSALCCFRSCVLSLAHSFPIQFPWDCHPTPSSFYSTHSLPNKLPLDPFCPWWLILTSTQLDWEMARRFQIITLGVSVRVFPQMREQQRREGVPWLWEALFKRRLNRQNKYGKRKKERQRHRAERGRDREQPASAGSTLPTKCAYCGPSSGLPTQTPSTSAFQHTLSPVTPQEASRPCVWTEATQLRPSFWGIQVWGLNTYWFCPFQLFKRTTLSWHI